jgi:hypothetical protein
MANEKEIPAHMRDLQPENVAPRSTPPRRTLVPEARRAALIVALIAALVSACSSGSAGSGASAAIPSLGPDGVLHLTIVARNIAFQSGAVTVPGGPPLDIVLDNQDAGVPHDLGVYAGNNHSTKLATTEIVQGPGKGQLSAGPLPAGSYQLICSVHPAMTVDLVVQGPA